MVDEPIAEAPVEDAPIVDEVATSSEEAPETETEIEVEAEAVATAPKKTIESVVKETFFSEIEALKTETKL